MSSNDPYLHPGQAGEPPSVPGWLAPPVGNVPSGPEPQWSNPTPPGGWSGYGSGAQQYPPAPGGHAAPAQPWPGAPVAAAPPTYAPANPYGAPGTPTYGTPGTPTYGAPSYGPPTFGAPGYGSPVGRVPGGPVYRTAPFGAPAYAPVPVKAPTNGWAVASFVTALVLLVVGVVSGFYFGSVFVLVMASQGIRKAKVLEAAGYGPRGRALAWWGLAIGVLDFAIVFGLKIAAV